MSIASRVDEKKETHKDQGGVQVFVVFLNKIAVVFVGFTLELIVELNTGVVGRSK